MNQMNEKMIVKILPAEGTNPEFAPEQAMQKGIECHGFILLTFDEKHKMETALVQNLSLRNISEAVVSNCNEDAVSTIRQGFCIAEGFIRASHMQMDYQREKAVNRMKKVLSGWDPDEDFPEELPQDFPDYEGGDE